MTRNGLISAFVLTFALGGSAWADGVPAPIAQCLQDNAAKVEQAIAALNTAADFLVNDVCIAPIAEEQQRQRQASTHANFVRQKKRCDAKKAAGQSTVVKSDGGEYDICETYEGEEPAPYVSLSASTHADPASIALASRLLLDLRLSHATPQRAK
jgi:hypothetical protein